MGKFYIIILIPTNITTYGLFCTFKGHLPYTLISPTYSSSH
jgi:hypothetical protein